MNPTSFKTDILPYLSAFIGIAGGFVSGWVANIFRRSQALWEERKKSYDEISDSLGLALINAEKMEALTSWDSEESDRKEAGVAHSSAIYVIRKYAARGDYIISEAAAEELHECYIDIHNIFEHEGGPETDIWCLIARRIRSAVGKFNEVAKRDLARGAKRKRKKIQAKSAE